MPDNNQFDEFFRNRLLDHSSPVNKGAWKGIHSQLGRVKAFHFWKWYVVGPIVVVFAVTAAHFVLSPVKSPAAFAKANPATATTPSSATSTSSTATTPPSVSSAAGSTTATPAAPPAANPATSAVPASNPSAATVKSSGPGTATTASSSPSTTTNSSSARSATGNAAARHSNTIPSTPHNAASSLHARSSSTNALSSHTTPSLHTVASHHHTTHRTSESAAGAGLDTRTAGNSLISTAKPAPGSPLRQSRTGAGAAGSRTGITAADVDADASSAPSQSVLNTPSRGVPTPHHLTKPSIIRLSIPASIVAKAPKPSSRALVPAPVRTHHGLDWSLDAYVSPDFPNKQFGFSYTAGARLTLALNKHWSATAGFQYSRINAHGQNDSIGLRPGHFSDVDLPVLIGYTFTTKGDLRFTARAGVIFSLYSQAQGELNSYPFGNRRGPSAYLGLDVSKPLNDRWTIFAEPYGRCLFTNINAFNPYPHQLFTEGLTLGIRYRF
jgi:hypothetical protein